MTLHVWQGQDVEDPARASSWLNGIESVADADLLPKSLGLVAWTVDPAVAANSAGSVVSNPKAGAVWLAKGTVVSTMTIGVLSAGSAMTDAQLGILDVNLNIVASTPTSPSAFNGTTGWIALSLSTAYTVPTSGVYYLACAFAGTTKPTILLVSLTSAVNGSSPTGVTPRVISSTATQGTLPSPWTTAVAGGLPVILAY